MDGVFQNFFAFAAGEASYGSMYYLGSIFGTVGSVLPGNGNLLATMFQVFNTSVLTLGTIILSYTSGVGILLTAHEGEILGKKYNGLWTPIRAVFGLSALLPSTTGYSYLQIALMWFILQGVGAADTLWTTTCGFINAGGTTAPAAPQNPQNNDVYPQMTILFEDLLCQAAMRYPSFCSITGVGSNSGSLLCQITATEQILFPSSSSPYYYCADSANNSNSFCQAAPDDLLNIANADQNIQPTVGVYTMGNSFCGTLTLGDPTTLIGNAQNQAYQQIVPLLGNIATEIVAMDLNYTTYVNSYSNVAPNPPSVVTNYCSATSFNLSACNVARVFPSGVTPANSAAMSGLYWPYYLQSEYNDFIATASNLYINLISAAQTQQQMLNNAAHGSTGNLADPTNGWIFAGSFFINIANNSTTMNPNNLQANITVTPASLGDSNITNYIATNSLANAASSLVDAITRSNKQAGNNASFISSGGTGNTGNKKVDNALKPFNDSMAATKAGLVTAWVNLLSTDGTNPIIKAMTTGQQYLTAVSILYPFMLTLSVTLSLLGITVMGNGAPALGIGVVLSLMPPMFALIAILFVLGATLAVYTPMIPFILFSLGSINWLTATLETMLAAPIIAIALVAPGGNHEIWGKAEGALMLLLNIFLRPSLMIFGLIAALLMSSISITYINQTFKYVINSMSSNTQGVEMASANVALLIAFMVAYTSLFITVLNKCFELIHVLPDKILRWIGGGSEQFGESGSDRMGQRFESGISKTNPSGVEGHSERISGNVKGVLKADDDAEKKKEEQSGGGSTGSAPAP